MIISLLWSSIVGLLGCGDERILNSFFLQYLWEFCLGMKLAEVYVKQPEHITVPSWFLLALICGIGMVLTGVMGWLGFPWRLYNDIPSLFGYISLALIIYKISLKPVNSFFCHINSFSYEWYLVHILVFQVVNFFLKEYASIIVISTSLTLSYTLAIWYAQLFKKHNPSYANSIGKESI